MAVLTQDFLFIHVPKSAGRSITKLLGGHTPGIPAHIPLSALAGTGIGDRFTFGFVRDPWDRMVSLYSFLCQKKLREFESFEYQEAAREMGFRKWLLDDEFFMEQDKYWRTENLAPIQQRSQLFWLEGCDFIGRVETIDRDISDLWDRIRPKRSLATILGRRRVPRINQSQPRAYSDYYDDQTRAFVAHHFRAEIERFGYVFGDSQEADATVRRR